MALLLVQHGKSQASDKDPDPDLTPEGIVDVERIAEVARGYRVSASTIFHSTKRRARHTAEIFASALQPPHGLVQRDGLKPMDDVVDFASSIKREDNHMIVGHLPFLEKLSAYLITGSTERPVFKFQNGGIVCLDIDERSGHWVIKWTLMPEIS